ncbi:MAG: hypothetical protein LBG80_20675 [Bacteroidales bacterium]|jgi:tetratricopeptide (TPR) repeat protein|nr:hypothetical protein [Bacteroidales bacterium]
MKYQQIIKMLLVVAFIFSVSFCPAQGIKAAQGQQKNQTQKKESDIKTQSKSLKSQFSLSDLLLLQKNSLTYAEDFLSRREWKLDKTSVDNDSYLNGLLPVNYNTITWSYKKNTWNNKAEAWFYLYQYEQLGNLISYQMSKNDVFVQIKTELQKSKTYKLISTEVIEDGIETHYKSDKLEIILKEYNVRLIHPHYAIAVYNYKEIEQLIEKIEKEREQAAREARERERIAYEEQLRIEAEQLRIEQEAKMREEVYQEFIQQAKTLKNQKRYEEAIKSFQHALEVDPDDSKKKTEITQEIEKINNILQVMKERGSNTYTYSELLYTDYSSINKKITENIKGILLKEKKVNSANITISCTIDTAGIITRSYTSTIVNSKLNEEIKQIVNQIKLSQTTLYGYTVSSKADFSYTISAEENVVKVKKNSKGMEYDIKQYYSYDRKIRDIVSSAPTMGNFKIRFNRVTINGQHHDENKLLKYTGTGRASNLFLSLLIPGLGQHRVTYGERTGLGITLPTYALIGTGIVLKFYSESEYKKYQNATEQADMNKYYNRANYSNQGFYACLVAGGIIWISDVIWVWAKGAKNKKEQKAYKRQYLGFYYHPQLHVSGLTYSVNF